MSNENWILDTGATEHMTFDRSNFIKFRQPTSLTIKMGNESFVESEGVGDILLSTEVDGIKNKSFSRTYTMYLPSGVN